MNQLIQLSGDRLIVTSLEISNRFGKQHKDVLRAIDNLECTEEYRQRNFAPTVYHRPNPSSGKAIPTTMYEITRDGFTFLCMGFTGKHAAIWKERYIEAFNQMEQALREDFPAVIRKLTAERDVARQAVLSANPVWSAVWRYRELGLTGAETSKLLGKSTSVVQKIVRDIKAAGLELPAPRIAGPKHVGKGGAA